MMRRALTTIALGARYASSLSTSSKRKILVLHGKGGSGASMKLRFQGIENALPEFDFTYATAPYELDGGGYQWWTLPPGVRSYQATEYGGVEQALDVVRSSQADVVWGHSQGAILLGFAAAQGILDPKGPLGFLKEKKLIINGASWPRPYETELAAVKSQSGSLETLHVLGASDDINPPEHAIRLAAVFRGETFVHDGGHYVPADDAALKKYRAFLLNERERADAPAVLPEVDDEPGPMIDKLFAALAHPSVHESNATLERVWDIAGDALRWIFNNDLADFVESARMTADTYPTSFYGATMRGRSWRVARPWQTTSSGWIGTCVVETVCADGRLRRWIAEARQRRRPPLMGTWYLESIGSSGADGTFDVD